MVLAPTPTKKFVKPVSEDDFNFDAIRRFEGGQLLKGYVPAVGKKSGVTIASGVDLGQLGSEKELWSIFPDDELVMLFRPYIAKRGDEAAEFLRKNPLVITKTQADKLDNAYVRWYGNKLALFYSRSSLPKKYNSKEHFADLPLEAKTVALSLAWHHGVGLYNSCPRFWGYFLMNDWKSVQQELWNFYGGKAYKGFVDRRRHEAKMLLPLTGGNVHVSPPTAFNPLAYAKGVH